MAVDNQKRILEACSACIAENGVRGMRVQDVAKRAGVSSGLLYYHFTDRDGLLAATLEYVNAESLTKRDGPATEPKEGRGEIRRQLLDEIQEVEAVKSKSIVWNEIRAIAVFEPQLATHLAASTAAWQEYIAGLILDQGSTDEAGARRLALLMTALVEGLSGRWLSGQITAGEGRAALDEGISALFPPN